MKTKSQGHNPAAAAEMAAFISKHQDQQTALFAKIAVDPPPRLYARKNFSGFLVNYPAAAVVFGVLITVWKTSSAQRPDHPGLWAAYTQEEWAKKAKTSVSTIQRSWRLLEVKQLMNCERGHHKGNRVLTYVRPTALGLWFSRPQPKHWKRLGMTPQKSHVRPLTDFELVYGLNFEPGQNDDTDPPDDDENPSEDGY